jgi:hypothetical protein
LVCCRQPTQQEFVPCVKVGEHVRDPFPAKVFADRVVRKRIGSMQQFGQPDIRLRDESICGGGRGIHTGHRTQGRSRRG